MAPAPSTASPATHHPPGRQPGSLDDIGSLLGRTFRALGGHVVPALVCFGLPLLPFAVAVALSLQAVDRLSWNRATETVTGFNLGLVIAAGAAFVVAAIIAALALLAANHYFYSVHVGSDPSLGGSFRAALRRLPRFVGTGAVLLIGFAVVVYGPLLVLFGLTVATDAGPAFVSLAFLLFPVMMVLVFWLGVKLAFFPVSSAVAPRGTSAIRSSFEVSRGRFWPVVGRLLLLALIGSFIAAIPQVVGQIALSAAIASRFETNSSGDLLIDGTALTDLSDVPFSAFTPNVGVAVLLMVVYAFGQAASQAVTTSGTTAMYADTGAPNNLGHG